MAETTSCAMIEAPGDAAHQARLITAAFESGDPQRIAHTLGVIARARGMTRVARDAGVSRRALYKALSEDGDPRLSTLTGVLEALGIKVSVAMTAECMDTHEKAP